MKIYIFSITLFLLVCCQTNKNETTQENITIAFPNKKNAKIYYLPFLGEKMELKGQVKDDQLICTLPTVEKGAVVWVE